MVLLWNGRYHFSDMSDLTGKNMRKYVHWYPYSSILDKTKNPDRGISSGLLFNDKFMIKYSNYET